MNSIPVTAQSIVPWNKGRLIGQKAPLKLKEIWAIRTRLQLANRTRDLALSNLGIDSKLGGCDLVSLRVRDISQGSTVLSRDHSAAENPPACPVRNHGTNPTARSSMD